MTDKEKVLFELLSGLDVEDAIDILEDIRIAGKRSITLNTDKNIVEFERKIKFFFDKRDQLQNIEIIDDSFVDIYSEAIKSFKSEETEYIQVRKPIILGTRTTQYFDFGNGIKLYPLPLEDSTRNKILSLPGIPCILEYQVQISKVPSVLNKRILRNYDEIGQELNLLINYGVEIQSQIIRSRWVTIHDVGAPISKPGNIGYTHFDTIDESFYQGFEKQKETEMVEDHKYYPKGHKDTWYVDKYPELSKSFFGMIDKLNYLNKKKFRNFCNWFYKACLYKEDHAVFLSLVFSAVESLCGYGTPTEEVTNLFKTYLSEYNDCEKYARTLYRMRGKVVHMGKYKGYRDDVTDFNSPTTRKTVWTLEFFEDIVRILGINWLKANAKESTAKH